MKPGPIHPQEDQYNFTAPDALVQWAQDHGMKVHGHTLVWHSQTAAWFFQTPAGGQLTRELAMARLKSHILTVVGRYKGKILSWDVVNEGIAEAGGPGEGLREQTWLQVIGPDFLTPAFKWAHEVDPECHWYYNDYRIEQGAAVTQSAKHASSLALLKRLKAEGAPIYGVGIQGHWHLETSPADVAKAIEDYEALGLKISISELDVMATGADGGIPGGGRAYAHGGDSPLPPAPCARTAH
jgi:endo-1,4-beta-xylanase